MIILTEITRNNGCITCVAYVEDCKQRIDLSFSESKAEFDRFDMPENYEWCKSHIAHAKKYLKSLIGNNIAPSEKTIMWY